MPGIFEDALDKPVEPYVPADPREAACVEGGGHFYVLTIEEGSVSIACSTCDEDPTQGYVEVINIEIPVTCKVDVTHYPANPNHADEYDVDYTVALDLSRIVVVEHRADPAITRHDDGRLTLAWPSSEPDTAVVTREALLELVDNLNAHIGAAQLLQITVDSEDNPERFRHVETCECAEHPITVRRFNEYHGRAPYCGQCGHGLVPQEDGVRIAALRQAIALVDAGRYDDLVALTMPAPKEGSHES
jgi:hypothetical protein